jgi:CubicO group peptidase (beta-lactamase class C family)
MEKKDIAPFQVAVGKDGKIIFEKAFGWANVEEQIPTTAESMSLVGSIEKPFVSTAMMILSEREQVDLRAPVNDYLGDSKLIAYQGEADDATVLRLLLHTTGLPYGYYIAGDEVPQDQKRSNRDLVDLAGVLVVPPGSQYQYTNIGYGLFNDIVREAAGEKIKEFIKREIIVPLGLEHSRFFDSEPPAHLIVTQNADDGVLPIAFDNDGYTALYSTASDLVRFGMFHLKAHLPSQQPILSDSSIDMLWQYEEAGVEFTTRRLAWNVRQDYGLEIVQHSGGGPGIHNHLFLIPEENVVIAFMCNSYFSTYWSEPLILELIETAISPSSLSIFGRLSGRGYAKWPKLDPEDYGGNWTGHIKGPKGMCPVALDIDAQGNPKLRIEGDSCSGGAWMAPSRKLKKDYGALLWRFDSCIPYLYPYAPHEDVILTVWPQGERLVGHAAAAKEKNFGRGENYVLPQYVELTKSHDK